ncbi:MAG: vWA domain-containing protein [Phycisphaerales bacterium]
MPQRDQPGDEPGDPGPASSWLDRLLGVRPLRDADGMVIPETPAQRFVRAAPPATMFALAISLFVHLVVLLLAALIAVGSAQAGGSGEGGSRGPVEVAVISESELAAMAGGSIEADAPAVPELPSSLEPGLETLDPAIGGLSDLGTMPDIAGGIGSGAGIGGAGDISGAPGLGLGGSGGGAASFFGAEARGTRFAYIVDVSGSMGYDGKIETLKRELSRSIDALLENAKYLVVAFSDNAYPLENRKEWVEASDAGRLRGRRAIATLGADGSTVPLPAFQVVFSMRPRPDAIYFMTDGQFDPAMALDILRLNAEDRVPIHCITFVSKEGEAVMRKIAEDSGGTYTHVPGPGGIK